MSIRSTTQSGVVAASVLALLSNLMPLSPASAQATPTQEEIQPSPHPQTSLGTQFSGSILVTGNASLLDRSLPSLNEKLTIDYALPDSQNLDLRIENYFESSYNENPPGVLGRNVNEHKFEVQLTYTQALSSIFFFSVGVLHHENFTFDDTYEWGIGTVTATVPLVEKILTLTANLSVEKRFSGGRFFYDTSTTLDYTFAANWTFEANYHRYENFGQSDPKPTGKQELEIGVIRQLSENQTIALSFFRHVQFGAPNDQFSFVKLKWGYGF